jgi:hypothetical protein
VILAQPQGASNQWLQQRLETYARRVLADGCSLIVIARQKGERASKNIVAALNLPMWGLQESDRLLGTPTGEPGEPAQPYVQLYSENMPPWAIANYVQSFDAGKRPNRKLRIEISVKGADRALGEFSAEHDILLRRAFANCDSVHLKSMDGGRSGAGVYCAYPNLTEGEIGPWTQAYFVKLDSRTNIFAEYNKYQETVHPYLPFYLAPRLTNDRCYLGAEHGIIVGDFVDESEGLLEAAENGRAIPSLAGLLDRTLLAWYRNARCDEIEFGNVLQKQVRGSISDERIARASAIGEVWPLCEIEKVIVGLQKAPVMVGPIHGDLHVGNVRVRHGEAVMIDFASQTIGPLLLDLARLEVSFLVDGFRTDTRLSRKRPLVELWLESILPLYSGDPLGVPAMKCAPDDEVQWFYACIEVIRKHARALEAEKFQYLAALVASLVFKALKDPDVKEPEATRRAAAYVLASRLAQVLDNRA